jgi:DNA-binding GntR family transcriptional regulator
MSVRAARAAGDAGVAAPTTVLQQAVAALREAILSGEYRPGERLVEADLCRRLDVSRASLREALRIVAAERLLTIVPNRGPSVAVITWDEAEQIYHVRAMLEGEAAYLAATRLDAAGLDALRRALQEFERAVARKHAESRLAATGRFYDALLAGCGNRVIEEVLQGLVARITFLRARSMDRAGRARESAAELRRLLQALEARDPRAARAAATEHVRLARDTAREVYERQRAA